MVASPHNTASLGTLVGMVAALGVIPDLDDALAESYGVLLALRDDLEGRRTASPETLLWDTHAAIRMTEMVRDRVRPLVDRLAGGA